MVPVKKLKTGLKYHWYLLHYRHFKIRYVKKLGDISKNSLLFVEMYLYDWVGIHLDPFRFGLVNNMHTLLTFLFIIWPCRRGLGPTNSCENWTSSTPIRMIWNDISRTVDFVWSGIGSSEKVQLRVDMPYGGGRNRLTRSPIRGIIRPISIERRQDEKWFAPNVKEKFSTFIPNRCLSGNTYIPWNMYGTVRLNIFIKGTPYMSKLERKSNGPASCK